MPREVIHQPTPREEGEGPRLQTVVGWQRDCEVQVGIQGEDNYHLADVIYGSPETMATIARTLIDRLADRGLIQPMDFASSDVEQGFMEAVGRDVLDAVTGSSPWGGSVWSTLTRYQVNTLIRHLRRGRDLAYGKDE